MLAADVLHKQQVQLGGLDCCDEENHIPGS